MGFWDWMNRSDFERHPDPQVRAEYHAWVRRVEAQERAKGRAADREKLIRELRSRSSRHRS